MLKFILVVGIFFGGVGCATRGENFSSDFAWIKKEQTNKADVLKTLGDPYQVGYASGQPTWTYGYYRYRLFGDSHTKELKFYWNRGGQVDSFSFTSSFPEDVAKGSSVSAPTSSGAMSKSQ